MVVQEKTFCNVPGVILHMEFLHPAPNDPDYVILVLFIVESVTFFYLDSCIDINHRQCKTKIPLDFIRMAGVETVKHCCKICAKWASTP